MKWVFGFIPFLLIPCQVFAFPELIKHGYSNCVTCHTSPNGGGLTTSYGRALSAEVLSSWKRENESEPLYGVLKFPEWFNLGGDFRVVQTHVNTPQIKAGRFLVMQADLEMGFTYGSLQLVGTLGKTDSEKPGNFTEKFMSRRHYVLWHPDADSEFYFRVGRFQRAFGIGFADHILGVRRGLGWDDGTETYNIEASWLSEAAEFFLTGSLGRPDKPELIREKGVVGRFARMVGDGLKVGVSYHYGASAQYKRHIYGPYGILGFSKKCYALVEIDFQNYHPTSSPGPGSGSIKNLFGWANYIKIDYEFYQGMHIYLAQDQVRTDFDDENTLRNSFGIGLQFFPRPHFDLLASFQKQRVKSIGSEYNDYLWFVFHYYL